MNYLLFQTNSQQTQSSKQGSPTTKRIGVTLCDSGHVNKSRGSAKLTLSQSTRLSSKNSERNSAEINPKCNQFCGFNFQQPDKDFRTQLFFEGKQDNNVEQELTFRPSAQSNKIIYTHREPKTSFIPPTPIHKICNFDEDIELNKIKNKGIMIVSSSPRKCDYQAMFFEKHSRKSTK